MTASPSRACRVVRLDVSEPLKDIDTSGYGSVYLCIFSGDRPIGRAVLPAPMETYPASWLADELAGLVNQDAHRWSTRRALVPQPPAPEHLTTTVVVATRDRPAMLQRCCAALDRLSPAADEVLIVDNGDVGGAVASIADRYGFRYLHEPVAGHSRARNRGLAAATSDLVMFTDDDVVVEPGWVAGLRRPFSDPLVVASTGLIFPACLDTPAQAVFEEHAGFAQHFETRVFDGASSSSFRAGSAGAGAALAVRADEVRRLGGFSEVLGGGTPTGSGEDHHLLHRILADGYRIVFEPSAVAHHSHRETPQELLRQLRGYGTGMYSYLFAAAEDDPRPGIVLAGARAMLRYTGSRLVATLLARSDAVPWPYVRAELLGALAAPRAFTASRRTAASRAPVPVGEPAPHDAWRERLLGRRDRGPQALATVTSELPTLSIVIPTRNRRESVLRLVRRLELQDYPADRMEVVVSLDGDVDGTEAALRTATFARPPIISRLPDRGADVDHGHGAGPVRDRGVASASNELIVFLDDDVEPDGRGFLRAHAAAHERSNVVAVGPCPPVHRDGSGLLARRTRAWWVEHTQAVLRGGSLGFTDLTTANVSLERAVFLQAGGFADMPRREDWELGYRLIQAGASLVGAPAAAVEHRDDPSIEGTLEDRRREGAGDARFVRMHPEVFGALTLQSWREMGRHERRGPVSQIVGRPLRVAAVRAFGPGALRSFEQAGLVGRYGRALSAMTDLMYWRGVGEELGSLAAWGRLLREVDAVATNASAPHIDLTEPAMQLPVPGQRHDLEVRVHGVVVGSAPYRWGGIPWAERTFVDEVWRRYGRLARPHRSPDDRGDATRIARFAGAASPTGKPGRN